MGFARVELTRAIKHEDNLLLLLCNFFFELGTILVNFNFHFRARQYIERSSNQIAPSYTSQTKSFFKKPQNKCFVKKRSFLKESSAKVAKIFVQSIATFAPLSTPFHFFPS